MKKIFTALLVFQLAIINYQLSFSQDSTISYLNDPNGRIREHNVDFIKMKLDVKFNAKEGKVIGSVKYVFKPIQYVTDTLYLNAPGIDIQKVLLDDKETTFSADSNGVTIRFRNRMDWNREYKLEISYEATPRKGIYFIGWNVNAKNVNNDPYFTRKQIWTQGQGIDNRYWIPCYDDVNDKLITETIITFDSSYTVISNGLLKDKKKNADGTTTWHYVMKEPMVPYLIMIAIDKYTHEDYKSKNGNISRQYYYADRPETVDATYQYSAQMMDFLQHQTGVKFPWESYANVPVQDFMYGAMENTTATIYTDAYLCDKRGNIDRPYVATNAHELTHQWFGDYVTEYSSAHHWLHESFATYYSKQFMHRLYGEDRYESDRRGEQWAAISADRINRFAVANSMGGSSRVYPKGSAVIDMLRYVVGDSVFQRCITHYLLKHAYSNVQTDDFKIAFMETAGINLDWFFDEWIYRSGFPEYKVSYERKNNQVIFYVNQTEKVDNLMSYFKMPVVFEVHFKDGSFSSRKEWLSHAADTVYVHAPGGKKIDYTLFDPGSNLIKIVDFHKSFDELAAQAENATHMIDRSDALGTLRDSALEKKKDLLIRIFNMGNYYTIQNEVLLQLSKDTSEAAIEIFRKALHSKDHLVRRGAVNNLPDSVTEIPASLLPDVEALLYDSSYYTIEITLRKLCKDNPSKSAVNKYLAETKSVYGLSNNVRILWLEISYGATSDSAIQKRFATELINFTSNKYEFRTRVHAMAALENMMYCNEDLVKNLFNACTYTNNHISNPASKCLKTLITKPENLQLAKNVFTSGNWKDWEKKIIEPQLK